VDVSYNLGVVKLDQGTDNLLQIFRSGEIGRKSEKNGMTTAPVFQGKARNLADDIRRIMSKNGREMDWPHRRKQFEF